VGQICWELEGRKLCVMSCHYFGARRQDLTKKASRPVGGFASQREGGVTVRRYCSGAEAGRACAGASGRRVRMSCGTISHVPQEKHDEHKRESRSYYYGQSNCLKIQNSHLLVAQLLQLLDGRLSVQSDTGWLFSASPFTGMVAPVLDVVGHHWRGM
jgi:hypothetical protein